MEKIKPKRIAKVWGHEEIGINTEKYCGKLLYLDKGYRCSIHRHSKDETFRVLSGMMLLELGEGEKLDGQILSVGDWIRIPSNFWHRFSGIHDTVFAEFSTPDTESERKTQSEKILNFNEWKQGVLK